MRPDRAGAALHGVFGCTSAQLERHPAAQAFRPALRIDVM
jgi:hypothetical protein